MNRFLADILAQPDILRLVLADLTAVQRDSLTRASSMISKAQRVVITSMGSALYSSIPMYYALRSVHPNVNCVETADLLREAPYFDQTLYIIMSRSGESGEIATFSQHIRANNGTLLAITMSPNSTLARNADLVVHDIASYDGLICTKAFTSLILCGLLIAFAVSDIINNTFIKTLDHQLSSLETCGEKIKTFLRNNADVLDTPVPYFLSRDVGMCVARAGALYMHEGALLPAVADSFGMFHHGPMELAEENFTALWIDLDPDAYNLDIYERALSQGATLIPVSVDGGPYTQGISFPWSTVAVPFRCLPAAMTVQLYAWWIADAHGHEAGDMRHLQWLIT